MVSSAGDDRESDASAEPKAEARISEKAVKRKKLHIDA